MALPFEPEASLFLGSFCGRPLCRASGADQKDVSWQEATLRSGSTQFLVFSTRKGSVGAAALLLKQRPVPRIAWQPRSSLDALGIDPVTHLCNGVPPIWLGERGGQQHFALLADAPEEELLQKGTFPEGSRPFVAEGMSQLLRIGCNEGDFTVVGHAFAKIVWHKKSRYCGACGAPTEPIECGAKRKCSAPGCRTRVYARTDPSCMVLVRSPSDDKCLLISGQDKSNPHMWTCVSGFVEQGEQVEEAARREVWEETGVEVDLAGGCSWLGTQPWPLGVGGACELMLGLEVVAASEKVEPNLGEVRDARWFTRDEVRALLSTPWNQEGRPFVPHFISEAHFLLHRWATRGGGGAATPAGKGPAGSSHALHPALCFLAGACAALALSTARRRH